MNPVDSGILLRVLRAAAGHIPGSELARELNAPQESIAARIGELKTAGYDIEEHPHFGYRLLAAPALLDADDLAAALKGAALARQVRVVQTTGSTNDDIARAAREGAVQGTVIFAEEQTAGRGRLGRRWESGPGMGLWFSILLRPAFPLPQWSRLATWAAVSIASAIDTEISRHAQIKWPNDIYLDAKKVAGILIETHCDPGSFQHGNFAILGIGINANHTSFPPELPDAASLRMITGHEIDRRELAIRVLKSLALLYPRIEGDFSHILAEAESRSYLRGKWIIASLGGAPVEGEALRLDEDGALLLRLADGSEAAISTGEVIPGTLKVRPPGH